MGGLVRETTPWSRLLHIELWEFAGHADLGGGVTLTGLGVGRYKAADITITGQDGTTRILIQQEGNAHAEQIDSIVREIKSTALWSREYLRDSQKVSAEWVIGHYYRSKARGSKPTLKQLADEYGLSHAYLRQAKRKYDQAGKWGAKSKNKPPEEM